MGELDTIIRQQADTTFREAYPDEYRYVQYGPFRAAVDKNGRRQYYYQCELNDNSSIIGGIKCKDIFDFNEKVNDYNNATRAYTKLYDQITEQYAANQMGQVATIEDDATAETASIIETTSGGTNAAATQIVNGSSTSSDTGGPIAVYDTVNATMAKEQEAEDALNGVINKSGDTLTAAENTLKKFQNWKTSSSAISRGYLLPSKNNVSGSTINASINIRRTIDSFGKLIKEGYTCQVCGKSVKYTLPNGYCSIECYVKHLLEEIKSFSNPGGGNVVQYIINKVGAILDYLDLVVNTVMDIPSLLKEINYLPEIYKDYCMLEINEIFLDLRICVNNLLIMKDRAIIQMLDGVLSSHMYATIMQIFQPLEAIITTITQLQSVLDTAYSAALKALQLPVTGGIEPVSMSFVCTPRSIMNPSYASKITVQIPKTNKMWTFDNIDFDTIEGIVDKIFPAITPPEYLLDPSVFQVRLLFSPQSNMVSQVEKKLQTLFKKGLEQLPSYSDLKLTNPYYVLSIYTEWGPTSAVMFGECSPPHAVNM